MELIPKVTISPQFSTATGQVGVACPSSSELGNGKVTPPIPQQSQVLPSSTTELQ